MTVADNPANTPAPAPPPHYLDGHALARPSKVALICGERSLTYAELNSRARRISNALNRLGVRAGDRVAVMTFNSIETLEIAGGLSKLSAIGVSLNYRLREQEVAYILNDCQAKVVIAGPGLVQVIDRARADVNSEVIFIAIGDEVPAGWQAYETLLSQATEEVPQIETGLGSSMSYTSGTTGKPKGAYRPNGVPVSEVVGLLQAFELTPADVHLLAGPYYHSAPSFFANLQLLLGATLVIQSKYDPVEALQLTERHKISTTFMAPTLVQRLCDVPEAEFSRYDVSSLRSIIVGGAPCPFVLKERTKARFGDALWEFYGATETGVVTIMRPEDQFRKPGSCGKAVIGQTIKLLDDEGNEVPPGVPGEMWVQNTLLAEYYNKPEATAKSKRHGYFTVGDIAYQDEEGFYFICDRKIDMIISGGANIYPAEIEAVLTAHPAVADVAVIGVPDDHWGEAVKAVVELRSVVNATAEELIAFCGQNLADYKKPRSVDFIAELPRNPAGKLLKAGLREPYWKDKGRRV